VKAKEFNGLVQSEKALQKRAFFVPSDEPEIQVNELSNDRMDFFARRVFRLIFALQ